MKDKRFILIAASIVVSIIVICLVIVPNVNKNNVAQQEISSENSEITDKATFMYFVTDNDLESGDLKNTLKKLEDEYGQTVVFDIKNVDKDKSLLDNFPVMDNTPALIMLKPNGDIVNMLFKTEEYDKLKTAIEEALAE